MDCHRFHNPLLQSRWNEYAQSDQNAAHSDADVLAVMNGVGPIGGLSLAIDEQILEKGGAKSEEEAANKDLKGVEGGHGVVRENFPEHRGSCTLHVRALLLGGTGSSTCYIRDRRRKKKEK